MPTGTTGAISHWPMAISLQPWSSPRFSPQYVSSRLGSSALRRPCATGPVGACVGRRKVIRPHPCPHSPFMSESRTTILLTGHGPVGRRTGIRLPRRKLRASRASSATSTAERLTYRAQKRRGDGLSTCRICVAEIAFFRRDVLKDRNP